MEDSNITVLIYLSIDRQQGYDSKITMRKQKRQPENWHFDNNFYDRLSAEEGIGFRFFFPPRSDILYSVPRWLID